MFKLGPSNLIKFIQGNAMDVRRTITAKKKSLEGTSRSNFILEKIII